MTETRFEGSSPVARYWLAKCEGFAVQGGARGVVEELIRDADPFVTTRLVVRKGRSRRTVVPADAVAAVDPAERVVFVEPRRRKPRAPRRDPVRTARVTANRAAAGARRGSIATARRLSDARVEATTRLTPAVVQARRTTAHAGAVTAAAARRNASLAARYLAERAAPGVRALVRSFTALAAEAVATVRMLRLR
jgi:hypothetical protein